MGHRPRPDAGGRNRRPDYRSALCYGRGRLVYVQIRPHGRTDGTHRRPDHRSEACGGVDLAGIWKGPGSKAWLLCGGIKFPSHNRDLPVSAAPRTCDDDSGACTMNVIRRRGWGIPDRLATPEHLVFDRRTFLAGGVSALALAPQAANAQRLSDVAKLPDPSTDLYPAKRNEKYVLDRPITDEKVNGNYNNFYEFGSSKTVTAAAQALTIRPWTVK